MASTDTDKIIEIILIIISPVMCSPSTAMDFVSNDGACLADGVPIMKEGELAHRADKEGLRGDRCRDVASAIRIAGCTGMTCSSRAV
ncbi:hypothetical protein Y032_0708g1718 [Ancylostoma ceylanicum]|uniref:Uncharacterized protein n=1 Tax=Ancylostoma ceylanicum TaxID=53326 RepID=A0A016WG47_9BILA|nr:hypothetical protein Y032_0708g1718 [Ancylostoma ceylanicum]